MAWKVRHQGSPKAVEVGSAQAVLDGIGDGLWEPIDEVQGPGESAWSPLENHPTFAEAAADIEPPPPQHYDDETHLDMTALIDVCMVLLIFFILTTSYAALQSRLDSPDLDPEGKTGRTVLDPNAKDSMIPVSAKMDGDKVVIRLGEKVVPLDQLATELSRFRAAGGQTTLLLDTDRKVPHGVVVAIQDAAKAASMRKINKLVP
jgi:biopolymer transport protein ExbD